MHALAGNTDLYLFETAAFSVIFQPGCFNSCDNGHSFLDFFIWNCMLFSLRQAFFFHI